MNENQNKNILLILIAAIIVAVSASFANNYFAYLFLSKTTVLVPKTGIKATSPINEPKKYEIDKSWRWVYYELSAKENNYPFVTLRQGYKAIKLVEGKVLMGWQYELLNTSLTTNYNVTVNFDLEDIDEFIVNESSSSENVPPQD